MRWLPTLAILLVLGCGSSEPETTPSEPTPPSAAATPPDADTPATARKPKWAIEWPEDRGERPEPKVHKETCRSEVAEANPELDFETQPVAAWKRMRECMESKGWIYKQVDQG